MNFEEFKDKYQKVPVECYPNEAPSNPVISVCVQTYQHADYIKECLDGILMQETNFPFEILLGEDASTDGTRDICLEYAKKYPDRIRLFLHTRENNIEIGGHPTGRFNFLYNLYNARGKYLAFCEGDDYWTDPLKLQKQTEFMEENEDCSICFHPTKTVYEDDRKDKIVHRLDDLKKAKFSQYDLISGKINMWTASIFFHSYIVKPVPDWVFNVRYGDAALKLICASKGHIGYIGEKPMSVYRRGVDGAWSESEGKSLEWEKKRLKDHIEVINYFNEDTRYKYEKPLKLKKAEHEYIYLMAISQYCGKKEAVKLLFTHLNILVHKPKRFILVCISLLFGNKVAKHIEELKSDLYNTF